MGTIKEKWVSIKEKLIPSGHKKAYSFIIAGVNSVRFVLRLVFYDTNRSVSSIQFFQIF